MASRRTPSPTRSPKSTAAPAAKSAQPPAEAAQKPAKTTPETPMSAEAAPVTATKSTPARRVTKPRKTKAAVLAANPQVSEETRRAMIAESAYLRAERRGFAPGGEMQDWCEAEKEVDALLNANTGTGPQ